jgi:hypothetical protein
MLSAITTAFIQVGRVGEYYCEAGNSGNPITSPDITDTKKGYQCEMHARGYEQGSDELAPSRRSGYCGRCTAGVPALFADPVQPFPGVRKSSGSCWMGCYGLPRPLSGRGLSASWALQLATLCPICGRRGSAAASPGTCTETTTPTGAYRQLGA